jgi:hypothetical protein
VTIRFGKKVSSEEVCSLYFILWKNSNLELKYDKHALIYATKHINIEILEWWKNSGLKLIYSEDILDKVFKYLDIHDFEIVEKWWNESGLLNKDDTVEIEKDDEYDYDDYDYDDDDY